MAREVGTEGKLGGQADVPGVAGTWKDLTDSVNQMAANLTAQVRNIAEVTTAVANGDLSKKITVDVKGEILELKNTINTMVDQLNAFAAEVTRWRARSAPKVSSAARRRCRVWRVRGRTSPTRERHGSEPDRPGARYRESGDRGRQRQPESETDRAGQGRSRRTRRNHQ